MEIRKPSNIDMLNAVVETINFLGYNAEASFPGNTHSKSVQDQITMVACILLPLKGFDHCSRKAIADAVRNATQ